MSNKLRRLFYTIIYLKPIQIYYQVWYRIRKKIVGELNPKKTFTTAKHINWTTSVNNNESYLSKNVFAFLNIKHTFKSEIDWNINVYGKLWTYNLNYFEFLLQEHITKKEGYNLILDYVNKENTLKDGKEPYPISLRGMNWVRFLSKHKIEDKQVDTVLYNHYLILQKKLEFHLLGNHLLENGFSLLFGAYYFNDDKLYKSSKKILKSQLEEQILNDGAHFELSPMYHKIILLRVLDALQLVKLNHWKKDNLHQLLAKKAKAMLSWLKTMTYNNGNIPMFNDCAFDIALSSNKLIAYAKALGISNDENELQDSGYRKIVKNDFEIFMDVGNIMPSYQPSHNHADTFNFELYFNNKPIIVDLGTSTYEKNKKRNSERSTLSHNTVNINGENSSDVWGGFRVAQRAKVSILKDDSYFISAAHNGYQKKFNLKHKRTFNFSAEDFIILDEIKEENGEARFHFHPDVKIVEAIKDSQVIVNETIFLKLESEKLVISLEDYDFCQGFNKTEKAKVLIVKFYNKLITKFKII